LKIVAAHGAQVILKRKQIAMLCARRTGWNFPNREITSQNKRRRSSS
jgi:hypothetical protein